VERILKVRNNLIFHAMKPKKKTERFIASYLWQGLKIKEKKEKALPAQEHNVHG
jgi:hypothetical protein